MSKNKHRGSDFREFLDEQGLLGEVEARALKQALSLQLDLLLKANELTKTKMAARMKTSRAAVDRLLDASNSSVTLNTLGKAARALGRKLKIELVPAREELWSPKPEVRGPKEGRVPKSEDGICPLNTLNNAKRGKRMYQNGPSPGR